MAAYGHTMDERVRLRVLELRYPAADVAEAAILAFWTEDAHHLRNALRALDELEMKAARLRMTIQGLESRGEVPAKVERRGDVISF